MATPLKKIISITLRTVVCVAAMYWVLSEVSLNDWARLPDNREVTITNWAEVANDPRVEDPAQIGQVTIQIDAAPGTITLGELAKTREGTPNFHIGLKSAWQSSNKRLILIALVMFGPVMLFQSIRFTWMIRAQDIPLSYWEGIKLSFAGNFMNYIAIGSTGGDIFKAYYVSTHTNRKTEAVTMVFLDRAVGLVSLILIAAIAMLMKLNDERMARWWPVIGLLTAGLLVGTVVVFSRRVRAKLQVDRLIEKLPFSSQIKRIDAATTRMREHVPLLISALLITLLLQGLAIAAMTVAGIGLGMRDDSALLPGYFAYLAMALLVAAIPVSPQGFGTMDGALQIFFRGVYGNYSQVLFLGFAMRILQLIWSLPGILVPITGAHRPSKDKIAALQAPSPSSES
ncbi:MAG: hypothetical protein HJJLKODD_02377 [Phycisphaerae bacterium]|nr:hypothetical protein [Phycisphaerae bacterium]